VKPRLAVAAAALVALPCLATPAAADVSLTVRDGRVTIVARNATPRQILEVWAREGHTRIVNVERVAGRPDTLLLTNEPEAKALAIVLRSVAGYIAAPRQVPMANASLYDRILIMPTSYAAPAPAYRASAPMPQPQQPTVFEVPDPTTLANDDNGALQTPPAPVFQQPDPGTVPMPPQQTPPNPATPYLPPPADANVNGAQAPVPPPLPTPGQQTTPAPGFLPVPQPQQQQQQPLQPQPPQPQPR
jgi:hypothetical protein